MYKNISSLADEELELCSERDSVAECEMASDLASLGLLNNDISLNNLIDSNNLNNSVDPAFSLKSSEGIKYIGLKENINSDSYSINISEMPSFTSKSSESIPTNQKYLLSDSKLQELKQVLLEVDDAYVQYKISEFLLYSYKECERQVPNQLADKMNEIISASSVQELTRMKSKIGETFNILGLGDNDVKSITNKSLSHLEKSILNKHIMEEVKANVEQLNKQQQLLKDMFDSHCKAIVQEDSLLPEKWAQLAKLYVTTEEQLQDCFQIMENNNQLNEQLLLQQQTSCKELDNITYALLLYKAKYLQSFTSIIKLRLLQERDKDKNYIKCINDLGYNLKISADDTKEQLKSQQKLLTEYEKKENRSDTFKEIVTKYGQTKRQLKHKQQTLIILNNPDYSFN